MADRYEYVIVGNSAGAVGAVEALRERDPSGGVAMISYEPGPAYCRALISYLITGRVSPQSISYRDPEFYRRNDVTLFSGVRAQRVDYHRRTVSLSDGRHVGYSKLLLATGGAPLVPPIASLDPGQPENVFTFTSMADALALKEAVDGGARRAVVLGAGLLGLLAAEALRTRGVDVVVVELADRVLSLVLDETASALFQEAFQRSGVEFRFNTTIAAVEGGKRIQGVRLKDGTALDCDLLVLATGVRPRTELADGSSIRVDRGIVVNRRMETAVPGVYACGDCTRGWDFVLGEFRNLPLWPVAYVGGRVAGHNMAGGREEFTWGTAMNAFEFHDLCAISAGVASPPVQDASYRVATRLEPVARRYRKLVFRGPHLVGFCFVGAVDRAGVYLHLMRQKADVTGREDALLDDAFDVIDLPEAVRADMLSPEARACRI